MALVNIQPFQYGFPSFPLMGSAAPALSSLTMDAAGEKVAFIGEVWFPEGPGTSKTLSSSGGAMQWLTGAVTWSVADNAIRIGIQDVSTTVGPVTVPDEDWTGEPYAELIQGVDAITATAWQTNNITTGTRTLTHGDLIAVVFDMTVRSATDSVTVSSLDALASVQRPVTALKSGAGPTWAAQGQIANVVIQCDDGTLCSIFGGLPVTAVTTRSFASNTATADEYGNVATLPMACSINGLWATINPGGNFEFKLYSGSAASPTQEQLITIDLNQVATANARQARYICGTEAFTSGAFIATTVRPTTTTADVMYEISVNTNAHLKFWPGGETMYKCTRLDDAGSLTTDTAKRIMCGPMISQLDTGGAAAASSGGRIIGS